MGRSGTWPRGQGRATGVAEAVDGSGAVVDGLNSGVDGPDIVTEEHGTVEDGPDDISRTCGRVLGSGGVDDDGPASGFGVSL